MKRFDSLYGVNISRIHRISSYTMKYIVGETDCKVIIRTTTFVSLPLPLLRSKKRMGVTEFVTLHLNKMTVDFIAREEKYPSNYNKCV